MDEAAMAQAAREDREAMQRLNDELLTLNKALKAMNDETKKLEAELNRLENVDVAVDVQAAPRAQGSN